MVKFLVSILFFASLYEYSQDVIYTEQRNVLLKYGNNWKK